MQTSPGRRLLAAATLAILPALAGTTAAWAWTTGHGHVGARDGTLRSGCHRYAYDYVVKPGSADWTLETWLRDPRGKPRGAGDMFAGSDPEEGHDSFGVCRWSVVPGRFTITARLRWYTPGMLPSDPPTRHTVWFKPAHFRLSRP
jgi:hypothetical protein